MFNSSLQETLARYSDPSRNPYAHILQSQPPGSNASQYLLQPLRPKLDLSGGLTTNQWKPKLKIDTETIEQPPGQTLQVFDSRGYYIQSRLRTRSQPRAQKVLLPGYLNSVTSAHGTNVDLCVVPSIVHNSSASRTKHGRIAPSVALRSPSIHKTTGIIAPASSDKSSAPGSCANPIIIADASHTQIIPCIPRLPSMGNMSEKEKQMEKGERRDAESAETKERESTTNEAKSTETARHVSAGNRTEDVEIKRCESATEFEPEKPETEVYESTSTEADRTERDTCESAAEMTTNESATDKATTEKDSHASTAPKLLRMERKINNKDLSMGWYMSETSSELRYPYECIAPKIGDVYVHCFRKEGNQRFQLWVRQISRGMTIWVKAHIFHIHPKLVDRRLTLSMTGEPYWVTRTSLMASGSRERASKVAEAIFYN